MTESTLEKYAAALDSLIGCQARKLTDEWGWGVVQCGKPAQHRGPHIKEARTFGGVPFTAIWRDGDERAQRYFHKDDLRRARSA